VGFLGWYMNIFRNVSYQNTHPQGFRNYSKLLLLFMGISLGIAIAEGSQIVGNGKGH
jgi:hypothetical protein